MSNDSTVTVQGNVTRDPELTFTPSGDARVRFGIAVNRRYQSGGEWKDDVSFFDVVAWRDLAQNVADSVAKGNRVIVSGRLDQRSWETDKGEKRSIVEIVADEIGASLRWATVDIKRNERREGGEARSGGAPAASAPALQPNEEPF